MSQIEKEEKLKRQENLIFNILLIPIIALLAITPLIVRLSVIQASDQVARVIHSNFVFDFFAQYKSVGIIAISVIMLIMMFLLFNKKFIKKDKQIIIYIIAALVFLGISFISAMTSNYREVALWGIPDRAEGFIILGCYILMFLYCIYTIRNVKDYKYIIAALSVLIIVSTILGAFQFFGKDLLMQDAIKPLIIPKQYMELAGHMSSDYESGKIYGTMYHYNYMGSFGAIVVPLFITMTIFTHGYKKKIALGVVSICSLFLLLGSTSRAGLIGLTISVLIGLILFGKVIVRRWKVIMPLIGIVIVIIIGFDVLTKGVIFKRVPTLIEDAFSMFSSQEKEFDYKKYIPIRDIVSKDKKTEVVLENGTLTFELVDGNLFVIDESGKTVKYNIVEDIGTTEDARFSHIQIKLLTIGEEQETINGFTLLIDGQQTFIFRADAEKGVYLVDSYTYEPMTLEEASYWGFEGKEKLGSARGYIWSRSLPMLKDHWLLGSGPDTFVLAFPQNDYLAKWWAYDTPNIIVDKPHNLYLQIALNQGVICLVAFLVLVITYIVDSIRLYGFKSTYSGGQLAGVATLLGIIGYLGAGIFNDSIISVAPIFWILLGTGVAINYLNNKEQIKVRQRIN